MTACYVKLKIQGFQANLLTCVNIFLVLDSQEWYLIAIPSLQHVTKLFGPLKIVIWAIFRLGIILRQFGP